MTTSRTCLLSIGLSKFSSRLIYAENQQAQDVDGRWMNVYRVTGCSRSPYNARLYIFLTLHDSPDGKSLSVESERPRRSRQIPIHTGFIAREESRSLNAKRLFVWFDNNDSYKLVV